jgi:hypothetical protein
MLRVAVVEEDGEMESVEEEGRDEESDEEEDDDEVAEKEVTLEEGMEMSEDGRGVSERRETSDEGDKISEEREMFTTFISIVRLTFLRRSISLHSNSSYDSAGTAKMNRTIGIMLYTFLTE